MGRELKPIRAIIRNNGAKCAFDGCEKPAKYWRLCNGHANQKKKGEDLRPLRVRDGNTWLDPDGYVQCYDRSHPNSRSNGIVLQHVMVMSEKIGRPLLPHENVHHINGVRDDNRPENLEIWSTKQPCGQRIPDKVAWAKEILALYEPEALAHPANDTDRDRGAA